jgi:hypothetical protein
MTEQSKIENPKSKMGRFLRMVLVRADKVIR